MQGFQIDLGVDEGRVQIAVPQQIGDGLQRLALFEQARGEGMAAMPNAA